MLPFAASALVAISNEIHTHTHTLIHMCMSVCVWGYTLRCFLVDGISLVSRRLCLRLAGAGAEHLNGKKAAADLRVT